MCSIIGYFCEGAAERVKRGLWVMKNRGKDAYGLTDGRNISIAQSPENLERFNGACMGHGLHAMVEYVPQPITDEGATLVTNCEIYNWRELDAVYGFNASNDADMLLKLLMKHITDARDIRSQNSNSRVEEESIAKGVNAALDELEGVFAFALWYGNKVVCARDLLGVKPLWHTVKPFSFASEKKVLEPEAVELNPRNIVIYDTETRDVNYVHREFFSIVPEHDLQEQEIVRQVTGFVVNAIAKRIPDERFGILFSGGVDSTTIALVCRQLGVDFTCYTAAIDHGGFSEAQDLVWAKRVADELGLDLKVKTVDLKEAEEALQRVVPLIEDSNAVKAGVALTFEVACQAAKKDGVRVMFSGLGSEEVFAGYERHMKAENVNYECLYGLLNMYERDNYRDDVITMNNTIELRLPFLDKELVEYGLKIPCEIKLAGGRSKSVLRDVAKGLGMPKEFADRKKLAAQYGSKTDRAIKKIAKMHGYRLRSEYLQTLYHPPNVRLGALISGGKDSLYAMYRMIKQNYTVECVMSMKSSNQYSYMFHTPNIDIVELQAEALGLPLVVQKTCGEKEVELDDLYNLLRRTKEKYGIEGVVTGAIFSNYQRERIENVCDRLGLKVFSPLWHMNQDVEMREIIQQGFTFVLSSIAAYGLDKSWVGRTITREDVNRLSDLNQKIGLNVAGEGGEFESLVLDMHLFRKKIVIEESEIVEESPENVFFVVKKARLEDKKFMRHN